jgi:hypothetical protein
VRLVYAILIKQKFHSYISSLYRHILRNYTKKIIRLFHTHISWDIPNVFDYNCIRFVPKPKSQAWIKLSLYINTERSSRFNVTIGTSGPCLISIKCTFLECTCTLALAYFIFYNKQGVSTQVCIQVRILTNSNTVEVPIPQIHAILIIIG